MRSKKSNPFSMSIALMLVSVTAHAQVAAPSPEYVPGEVIVKLKSQSKIQSFSAKLMSKTGEPDAKVSRSWSGMNLHRMALKPGLDAKAYSEKLKKDADVEYAEPNYYVTKQSSELDASSVKSFDAAVDEAESLNVELLSAQTTVPGYEYYMQTNAPIQVEEAWATMSSSKPDVVVAIIDSGVDYNHRVFTQTQAIWTNSREIANNGVDDDGNGYVDDVRGWNFVSRTNNPMDDSNHGTHVAGIVLGVTQNIYSSTLTRSKIKIMPLKFLDGQGRGTTSDAISAIMYAINNGAHVLNNSWGGGGYSQALRDAIQSAYNANKVFIAAAGNASNNNDVSATYPASYTLPNVLSIAASTDSDGLAGFSNYGKQTVHIASPGQGIYSLLPNNSSGMMSGTSMATPVVAGLAALVLRENSALTSHQVRALIEAQSNFATRISGKVETDSRINVLSAVQYAKTGNPNAYEAYPPVSGERNIASSSEQAKAVGGGCASILMGLDGSSGQGPGQHLRFFGTLFLLVSPILGLWIVRQNELRKSGASRRKYDRYKVSTQVSFSVDGRELVGSVSSISVGGVQLDTNAMLDNGGIVQMKILSPDGRDAIEVSGHVVWSEKEKSYGVAFDSIGASVKRTIEKWQTHLIKT